MVLQADLIKSNTRWTRLRSSDLMGGVYDCASCLDRNYRGSSFKVAKLMGEHLQVRNYQVMRRARGFFLMLFPMAMEVIVKSRRQEVAAWKYWNKRRVPSIFTSRGVGGEHEGSAQAVELMTSQDAGVTIERLAEGTKSPGTLSFEADIGNASIGTVDPR
ncbi:hypothetical protein ARMGADRAFT_1040546 [Armillaria gallica]|uniref:Uncharacterized protein n=1 Tax=Armillaria gallica TaxID=47427 RepID=A0A2H3C9M9_ARMGA|nr:hypothetical protein ARMGADRAFT_1040546 [Armillaria gallica]